MATNPAGVKVESVTNVVLVTGNANKLREIRQIVADCSPENGHGSSAVLDSVDLDVPELQGTPEFIAAAKCKAAKIDLQNMDPEDPKAQELRKKGVLTEDTALCFSAMNGLPGPYIKWFLKELKPGGLCRMINGFDDRGAWAQTTLAYLPPGAPATAEPILFVGKTEGKITAAPRGGSGFGWDSIFEPNQESEPELDCKTQKLTYAEMPAIVKNKISHRRKAVVAFCEYLAATKAAQL